jgi:hypothetical protein
MHWLRSGQSGLVHRMLAVVTPSLRSLRYWHGIDTHVQDETSLVLGIS